MTIILLILIFVLLFAAVAELQKIREHCERYSKQEDDAL